MDDLEFFNSGVKQQIEIFFGTSENDKMKEELERFLIEAKYAKYIGLAYLYGSFIEDVKEAIEYYTTNKEISEFFIDFLINHNYAESIGILYNPINYYNFMSLKKIANLYNKQLKKINI